MSIGRIGDASVVTQIIRLMIYEDDLHVIKLEVLLVAVSSAMFLWVVLSDEVPQHSFAKVSAR